MEALFLLKKMLPGDKMCKIDLKYVYLQSPFQWNPGDMSDFNGKAFYMSFAAFALGFLQLLWFLQSY